MDILKQARHEMNLHGYTVEATTKGLIAEVERLRMAVGEMDPPTPWRLKEIGIRSSQVLKQPPSPGEIRVGVDAMTDMLQLHELLMESGDWPSRFSPEDKERVIEASLGIPGLGLYPFTHLGDQQVPAGYVTHCRSDGRWAARMDGDDGDLFVGVTEQQVAAYCWMDHHDGECPVAAAVCYRLYVDTPGA